MKKIVWLCIALLVTFAIGCSDDDVPVGGSASSSSSSSAVVAPRDLVSYDVNNLIDNGDTILQTVADSYSDVGDSDFVGIAACAADFAIYPDDLADEATFSTRMRRVYHSTNGLFEAWKRDQVINAYDPSTAVIDESEDLSPMNKAMHRGFFKKLWKKAKSIVKKNFGTLIRMVPGVGPFLGSAYDTIKNLKNDANGVLNQLGLSQDVARQVTLIQNAGGFNLAPINSALSNIDLKLDLFGKEMRLGFADVNSKIGTVLDNLVSLRGDVNILLNNDSRILYGLSQLQSGLENLKDFVKSAINEANMNQAIINHKAFIQAYAEKSSTEIASNFVWENTQVSYQGRVNIDTFLQCAMNIQNAAKNSSDITNSTIFDQTIVGSEENPKPPKHYVALSYYRDYDYFYNVGGPEDEVDAIRAFYLDYTNPKKAVPISLGNLEFLIQMMNDNLRLNNVIFFGEALKNANAKLAASYLNIINTQIKTKLIQTIREFREKTALYANSIYSFSWEWARPTSASTCTFWLADYTWSYSYGNQKSYMVSTWPQYSIVNTDNQQNCSENVASAGEFYFNDYLGLYLAKLMAYEVRLRAYL